MNSIFFLSVRLGSKLPPGASQPPHFANQPWETQPQARGAPEPTARSRDQKKAVVGRPLNHIPHIRNPKLRQYYLQGTPEEPHYPTEGAASCHQVAALSSSLNLHFIIVTLWLLSTSLHRFFWCHSHELWCVAPVWQQPGRTSFPSLCRVLS